MSRAAGSAQPAFASDDDEDVLVGSDALRASLRVEDAQWGALDPAGIAQSVLLAIVAHEKFNLHNATCDIVFSSDETLRELNATFRGKDAPTNVLAFPSGATMPQDGGAAGEIGGIAIAYGVMAREAAERDIGFFEHASHLALHGVLHLLGYDHENDDERIVMEGLEIDILRGLGIADPYEGK